MSKLFQVTKVLLFLQTSKFFIVHYVYFKHILYSTAVFADKFWLNEIYFVPLHVHWCAVSNLLQTWKQTPLMPETWKLINKLTNKLINSKKLCG
jgi:hypothetical protein